MYKRQAFAVVGGQFAEQQDVFRAAYAHFGAVLTLLGPAQAVGLVIFPHHIGNNGNHAKVGKAVADEVRDAIRVERLNRRHPHAGDVAKLHTAVSYTHLSKPLKLILHSCILLVSIL